MTLRRTLLFALGAGFGVVFAAAAGAAPVERLPVAAVIIYPGDVIDESMLSEEEFPGGTSEAYPVVATGAELAGKVAKRTLLPGKLIARNAVAEPELVARGTIVLAVFEDGTLKMSTTALALQAGSLGEGIQVRNIDSGKVIFGVVQPDGTVRIGGR